MEKTFKKSQYNLGVVSYIKLSKAYDVSEQHCGWLKLRHRIQLYLLPQGNHFLWRMSKCVNSLKTEAFHINRERGSIVLPCDFVEPARAANLILMSILANSSAVYNRATDHAHSSADFCEKHWTKIDSDFQAENRSKGFDGCGKLDHLEWVFAYCHIIAAS